jgi:predicted Fe-Mo cluster-binding NifX family protein
LRKPLASLSEEAVDAVVVGGIGTNAVKKLHAAGIAVFLSEFSDVEETVDAHARGALQPVRPDLACGRGRQEP